MNYKNKMFFIRSLMDVTVDLCSKISRTSLCINFFLRKKISQEGFSPRVKRVGPKRYYVVGLVVGIQTFIYLFVCLFSSCFDIYWIEYSHRSHQSHWSHQSRQSRIDEVLFARAQAQAECLSFSIVFHPLYIKSPCKSGKKGHRTCWCYN